MSRETTRAAIGVFLILLASYAFFWHGRDWNVSSRLMLTYSLVDRGRVTINGLEDHTYDRARIGDRYYSDKQPGYSLLAAPPYAACRLLGLPPHPLERKGQGFTHWAADYWATLATSGILTALCGAILTVMAAGLGCGPRRSALVGLAYGLATPAYVYATLAYGHQATACLLLACLGAIERAKVSRRPGWCCFLAGVCAAYASVVELQVGPVSALMGVFVVGLVIVKRLPMRALVTFSIGAAGPTAVLLGYNIIAFGSPFDMGYFHEDIPRFRDVHSAQNPLGLKALDWDRVEELLVRPHRGLLIYAPVLILSPLGWVALAMRRAWAVAIVSLGACLSVFLVNLSYPEWTGGMSTGPRLLVPLLPFAMLPVAALLATGRRAFIAVAVVLATIGGVEMLMFQGVGGRIAPAPEGIPAKTPYHDPWLRVVLPHWRGDRVPGPRFDRTLVSVAWPKAVSELPAEWQWIQFLPLVGAQGLAIAFLLKPRKPSPPRLGRSDPVAS